VPPASTSPPLRGHVRSLQAYDITGFPAGRHVGLPSAGATLVLALDPPLDLTRADGSRRRMTGCLAGIHERPVTIHHEGTQRGVQLALSPLALVRLFGVPADALADQSVDLADVWGARAADRLLDRVASAPTWRVRLLIVDRELSRRLSASTDRAVRPEVRRALALLTGSGGTARVRDLADEVGWSTRHLTQQFAAAVGAPPKTFGRLIRFERSVAAIRAGAGLAETAARCGFADQAHLTREWARLAGTPPSRWLRRDVLANVQDGRHVRLQDGAHERTH
jgi:AraC-like DNA-binding protein